MIVEPARTKILDDARRSVMAWRLVETDPFLSQPLMGRNTPWVGRQNELTKLLDVFTRTVDTGRPHRLTVIGTAGIGKTRLGIEFADAVDGRALVLTGHCPPYGEGITFWPLREIIQEAAGGIEKEAIDRLLDSVDNLLPIADHVAGAIGSFDPPPRPDVLFPSLRTFFESLARDRPLVLILEDLHWAQPTFIDLVDYLGESVEGPVMLLCLARPEFLGRGLASPASQNDASLLILERLDGAAVDQLVDLHRTKHEVSLERAQKAVEIAEGNPLFIEQILATLEDNDGPTIPPSIQALLVARLDRLGPAERDLIRSASVLGRRFRLDHLKHLIPDRAQDTASRHLESLEQKALIAVQDDGASFEFRHALIQLVSYQTLTKETRATLHAQVGGLLDQSRAGDAEADEIAGYHYEKASGFLSELGIDDAHSHQMASKAAEKLTTAGFRAFARFDMPAAENLLTRAVAILGRDLPDWWAVCRRLAEVDQVMGRHDKAIEAFDGLIEEAVSGDDKALEYFFRFERAWARIAIGPDPISLETIEKEIKPGQDVFEKGADSAGLAQVFRLMLQIHYRRGRMLEMESAGHRELEHALNSGHPREVIGGQWLLAMAFEQGPRPVTECIELCQDIRRWGDTENPGVVSTLGHLWAMLGEFEKARRMSDGALQLLKERIRARRPKGQMFWKSGEVALLAGNLVLAEEHLRKALNLNLEMGEMDMICQIAASLSRMLARKGDIEEAARFATMSQDYAPAQSVPSQARWRSAQARINSVNEKFEQAESLGQEARALLPAEMLNLRAAISVDLGEVLLNTGQRDHGTQMIREAIDLFQDKGNTVGAAQAAASLIETTD